MGRRVPDGTEKRVPCAPWLEEERPVATDVARRPLAQELLRVRAVEELGLAGTAPEERFDRITRLARQVFGVQSAAVTLVDGTTQYHKAQDGRSLADGPRETAFCDHTIRSSTALVVEDAVGTRVSPASRR